MRTGTAATAVPVPPGAVLSRRWRLLVAVSAGVLASFGAAHLVTVGLLWDQAQPGPLHDAGIHPEEGSTVGVVVAGALVLAGLAYVLAAVLLVARLSAWRTVCAGGLALSAPLLLWAGPSAGLGVVLDLGVLGVLALGAALPVHRGARTWSEHRRSRPRPALRPLPG